MAKPDPCAALRRPWPLAVLALLLAGCVSAAAQDRPIPPILCERGHANFAPGSAVVAFAGITANGEVLRFDSRAAEGLHGFALLDLALPERPRAADLLHRYVVSVPTGDMVPAGTRARIAALAETVRDGDLVRESAGAGGGQTTLECYVPMPEGIRFQRVTVASHGDWSIRNTHPATAELEDLLTAVLSTD